MCTPQAQQMMQGASGGTGVPPQIAQQISANPQQAANMLSAAITRPKPRRGK